MKRVVLVTAFILLGLFGVSRHHSTILEAQTLPYVVTATWTAPADGSAVSYNCYLDGAFVINVTATTCQMSVATLGAHTAAVTSVNPNDIPSESDPISVAFTLKKPSTPTALKLK